MAFTVFVLFARTKCDNSGLMVKADPAYGFLSQAKSSSSLIYNVASLQTQSIEIPPSERRLYHNSSWSLLFSPEAGSAQALAVLTKTCGGYSSASPPQGRLQGSGGSTCQKTEHHDGDKPRPLMLHWDHHCPATTLRSGGGTETSNGLRIGMTFGLPSEDGDCTS